MARHHEAFAGSHKVPDQAATRRGLAPSAVAARREATGARDLATR